MINNPGNCVTQLHWQKLVGGKQDVLGGKKRSNPFFMPSMRKIRSVIDVR